MTKVKLDNILREDKFIYQISISKKAPVKIQKEKKERDLNQSNNKNPFTISKKRQVPTQRHYQTH